MVVRSTKYEVIDGIISYLVGESVTTGGCIVVQPYTPYMLENNDPDRETVIGWVMNYLN